MLRRHFLKEEEFLDEFYDWAAFASAKVNRDWLPDASCNDQKRRNQEYFLKSGEMDVLFFSSAAIHEDANGLSAQIVLESSKRIVNVKVRSIGNDTVAEIIVDRQKSAKE